MTVLSPPRAGQAVGPRRVAAHLAFRRAGGRTMLAAQRTPHPFHITRPFHLAGDPDGMATLYLQSSAGGLYGDDDLSLDIETGRGAAAHVTTQASSIVHASRGGRTRQAVTLRAGEGSFLEYLPDPAILFAGADLEAEVTAHLAPGARLLLSDSALTHDPAGQGAPFLRYANTLTIHSPDGAAIARDRSVVTGQEWHRRTGRLPVHGMLIAAGAIFPLTRKRQVELPKQENPARMKVALSFAALYVTIIFAVAAAREHLGEGAIYGVAFISGLTDVDAMTLSVAQLFSRGELDPDTAWRSIFLASLANLLFKVGAACVLGCGRLRLYIAVTGIVTLAAGTAILLLWPAADG